MLDLYHVALVFHLLALMAAVAASAIMHLAGYRRAVARTVREALEWQGIAGKTSITFPIALLVLVGTGALMLMQGGREAWRAGFVGAGFAGAIAIFAIGLVLKGKGQKLAMELVARVQRGEGDQAPAIAPDPVGEALVRATNAIVLGVVLVMTLKPSAPIAFGTIAVLVAAAVALGGRRQAATVVAGERKAA